LALRLRKHDPANAVSCGGGHAADTGGRAKVVGAFVEQSYFLVAPFILPIPAAVLIAHKVYDQVTGIAGHAGHEYFASPSARSPWPMLCTTVHDQHHGHFHYNYGNTFSIWDRAMGTVHPDHDTVVRRFEGPVAKSGQPAE
jgi:Delta7-sterol 5-desaturase